jgi:structural maintenance of chromosomes protein 6
VLLVDEFDVYMDAVNRRVSIDMIVCLLFFFSLQSIHKNKKVKTANASNKKQYILITPLDMTSVHVGPTIRVNRMPDPERGQDVLT